jgi:hypothetical protein
MSDEMRRLVHDVGKYVARTARNLAPETTLTPPIVAMLTRDLYETYAGERASAHLGRSSLAALAPPAYRRARELLEEIDRLEPNVRAGEPPAVRRAAALACEVERALRSLITNGGT